MGKKITVDSATLFNKVSRVSLLHMNCIVRELICPTTKPFFFWIGSWSYRSPLLIWGWLWWCWDCNSPTVNHTFYDWDTGAFFSFSFWLGNVLRGHCYQSFILWSCEYLWIFYLARVYHDSDISWGSFWNCSFDFFCPSGFISSGSAGMAWYAPTNSLHNVLARKDLLLWCYMASAWPLQVGSSLLPTSYALLWLSVLLLWSWLHAVICIPWIVFISWDL